MLLSPAHEDPHCSRASRRDRCAGRGADRGLQRDRVRGPAALIGQTAGASRFRDEAAFAMHIGTAPLPVSSGKSERYRLNRTGNRRLNSAVHVIAVTQARMYPPAIAFVERKRAEGMSNREALRCLKRHIGRTLFKTMVRVEKARGSVVVRVEFASGPVAVAV